MAILAGDMKNLNVTAIKKNILPGIQLLGLAMFISSAWNDSGIVLMYISLIVTMTPHLLTGKWRSRLGYFLLLAGAGLIVLALHFSWELTLIIAGVVIMTVGAYQIFRELVDDVNTPRKALKQICKQIK